MNNKKYIEFMNKKFVGLKDIFELLTNNPFNKKGELTENGEDIRKQLIATVKGLECIGLIEPLCNSIEDEIDNILDNIEYAEKYKLAYQYLETIVKEENIKYYDIVEDSYDYEYEYGLLLIIYNDEDCEDENYHICIDIMNCDNWL